jgi:ABC-2 type transport system permease protein
LKNKELNANGIDQKIVNDINAISVKLLTRKNTDDGIEKGNSGTTTIIGFLGAFLIYFFIFLYGVQVMKGVIEEKTNRIVEVIISSVKPFQLMMGKIIGIAMVGITQFVIWVVLITALSAPVSALVMEMMHVDPSTLVEGKQVAGVSQEAGISEIFSSLSGLNIPLLLGLFVF